MIEVVGENMKAEDMYCESLNVKYKVHIENIMNQIQREKESGFD